MTDAMENAALAFDQSMGHAPARQQNNPNPEGKAPAPEPIFENMGEHLETSDEVAGGDGEPEKKVKKVLEVPDEGDEGDTDEGDDDENQGEEGDDGADPDDDEELTEEEKEALKAAKGDDDDEVMNQEFEVMVDGVEKKVKLKEALDGYIRTETFHQRLNQLNEVKTALISQAEVVIGDHKKATTLLKEAEDILAELMPAEPNWDEEFLKDGVRANGLRKQYDVFKSKIAEIRAKRETAETEARQKSLRETTEFAQQEYPRFVRAAGWKNTKDQIRDTKSMRKTALAIGFSEAEVSSVYDSRLLQVLLKASKYDRMMASRPKPVQKTNGKQQPSLGAGRTVSRTAPKGTNAAQSQLSKTGSIDDAAAVFDTILSQSRKRSR